MKRHFQSDDEIPPIAWELFPECNEKLQRINKLEGKLESAISSRKRVCFAMNSEPEIKTKILRIHLRHEFIASTAEERSHFIVTIEGHILDKSSAKMLPFGNFLDKIRIQMDKRSHPTSNLFEWSAESYPEGVKGHCFRVKVYGDKAFPIKVLLYRSNDIRPRYELSAQLREFFPSMQTDPTEEQVLLAMWTYLTNFNLLEGKDRRQVKCNMELQKLLGVETLPLFAMRQRISEHLLVCKPIQVEYSVTTTSSVIGPSFGPNAVSKGGGKAFDIEVDVKDPFAPDILGVINEISKTQRETVDTLSQMELKASFLARAITDSANTIRELLDLQSNPLQTIPPVGVEISTTKGYSSGLSMKPSAASDLLLRASDPFSLVTRRVMPISGTRRTLRPQRSLNMGTTSDSVSNPASNLASNISSDKGNNDKTSLLRTEETKSNEEGDRDSMDVVHQKEDLIVIEIPVKDSSDAMNVEVDMISADSSNDDGVSVDKAIGVSSGAIDNVDSTGAVCIDTKTAASNINTSDINSDNTSIEIDLVKKVGKEEGEGLVTAIEEREVVEDELKVKEFIKEEMKEKVGEEVSDVALKVEGSQVSLSPSSSSTLNDDIKKEIKSELAVSSSSSSGKTGTAAVDGTIKALPVVLPRALDTLSAIHGSRGFLDVGNDLLFASSEPWVLPTAALIAKHKWRDLRK